MGNACDVNLGPEALVYLPSRYTFAGSLREGAYPGAVIVAFCEARDESGEVVGEYILIRLLYRMGNVTDVVFCVQDFC